MQSTVTFFASSCFGCKTYVCFVQAQRYKDKLEEDRRQQRVIGQELKRLKQQEKLEQVERSVTVLVHVFVLNRASETIVKDLQRTQP